MVLASAQELEHQRSCVIRELQFCVSSPIKRGICEKGCDFGVKSGIGRDVFDFLRVRIGQADFRDHQVSSAEKVVVGEKVFLKGGMNQPDLRGPFIRDYEPLAAGQ